MFYELLYGGYRLGTFPTEAEAIRRAYYLPNGCYTVREWAKDGDFSTFDPSVNNPTTLRITTVKTLSPQMLTRWRA